MTHGNSVAPALAALSIALCAPVQAHHGTGVTYDHTKIITLNATVTEWALVYPHAQLFFDVTNKDGKVEHWAAEVFASPNTVRGTGITRRSIKPGDKLEIKCNPHRLPESRACLAREIVVNGKYIPELSQNNPAPQSRSTG